MTQAQTASSTLSRVAQDAAETLNGDARLVRDRVAPALQHTAEQAEAMVREGIGALREHATALREQAVASSDRTVGYIRDEPVKSVLIAAAAGAALLAIAGFALRSRRPL